MPLAPPPADASTLHPFPAARLERGQAVHRIHLRIHDPFFFRSLSAEGGRYDLERPNGACYLADTAVGAWLEVFRHAMSVDLAELRDRRLARITTPRTLGLADLTAPGARGFGVTGEIHTIDDYTLPRAWASALHSAGWRGLAGKARHDPALHEGTVTLLDQEGAHEPFGEHWPFDLHELADNWALHDEMRTYGYVIVMPIPHDVPTIEASSRPSQ